MSKCAAEFVPCVKILSAIFLARLRVPSASQTAGLDRQGDFIARAPASENQPVIGLEIFCSIMSGVLKMKPRKVRLFIKPFCGWCYEAQDWLDERRIQYDTLDVIADCRARREMFELSDRKSVV